MLTTEEVAAILRVTPDQIYNWKYRGTGPPAYRIGRELRFDPDELETWLISRRGRPPSP